MREAHDGIDVTVSRRNKFTVKKEPGRRRAQQRQAPTAQRPMPAHFADVHPRKRDRSAISDAASSLLFHAKQAAGAGQRG